ncbi:hypothetical protein CHS0354_041877 [Potamilus streckersoni]|uniref:PH domain-containing protein n=1 Tax=Potamilus streckersoni TaxID=2493646 RepID=A0AAE0ST68_9BIVA|nr:hypothetical protein CHS0354_041877 [Potamilus streckersoni]
MKTMVGMARVPCGSVNPYNKPWESSEVKSGSLLLIQQCGGKTRKVYVFVRVYRSSFERYAVIYKDQKFSAQSGYLSLKNCTVCKCEHKDNQLRVILNNFEGNGLIFECTTKLEVQNWIDALQPNSLPTPHPNRSISPSLLPPIPRTLLMPSLAEESESEEGQ